MLRQLEGGIEITGRGSVRLCDVDRPRDDDMVLDFRCELADADLAAATWVRTLGGDGIVSWVADLAESYRGWDGIRTWQSIDHDLRIDATHDGRGHVALRFVIRGPRAHESSAWEASVSVTLDAGEDMRSLAAALNDLVS